MPCGLTYSPNFILSGSAQTGVTGNLPKCLDYIWGILGVWAKPPATQSGSIGRGVQKPTIGEPHALESTILVGKRGTR